MFLEHSMEKKAASGCCRSAQPSLGAEASSARFCRLGWGANTQGPGQGPLRRTLAAGNWKAPTGTHGDPTGRWQSSWEDQSRAGLGDLFLVWPSCLPGILLAQAGCPRSRDGAGCTAGQPSRSLRLGLQLRAGLPHPVQSDRTDPSHFLLGHNRPDPDARASEAGCSVSWAPARLSHR